MSLIILLSSLLSLAAGQLSVSLVDTAVMVNEGEQFALRVRKSGPITQSITVIVEVSFQGFSLFIEQWAPIFWIHSLLSLSTKQNINCSKKYDNKFVLVKHLRILKTDFFSESS